MAEKEQPLINQCCNQNPALSYLKTLKTSSTAHVLRNIAADFVKTKSNILQRAAAEKRRE